MLLADSSSIAQRHPIHHEHVNCRTGSFVNCHQCTAVGAAWLLPERGVEWDDGGEGATDESARSLSPSGGVTPLMAFFASTRFPYSHPPHRQGVLLADIEPRTKR